MRIEKATSTVFTGLEDGTGVLLNLNTLVYYSLNTTGAVIWREIEANQAVLFDDLVNSICEEYDVGEKEARQHLGAFIERLEQYKMITIAPN
jgi:hypothetical protein